MSIKTSWPRLLLCIAALQACGGDDDAGMDAGSFPEDASSVPDTGSSPDATTPDAGLADGGTPPDASRPEDASMPVDAGPECEPGAMRVAPCGNCGMGQEVCSEDGYWESAGTCLNEGECAPGELETESLPLCAERSRLCSASCEWGAWDETEPAGECEPGRTRSVPADCGAGEFRDELCSTSCVWEASGPCTPDACGGTRRYSPADAEEICIPGGRFVRGSTLRVDTQPVSEIFISSHYIDRYPVTVRRYRECYEAGVCGPPYSPSFLTADLDALEEHVGVVVPTSDARRFCEWQGGRLPTEAEWERAARGPAPREVPFPWGSDYPSCGRFMSPRCPGWDAHVSSSAFLGSPGRFYEFPDLDSYYGVSLMFVSGREVTADGYDLVFYRESEGESDPWNRPAAIDATRAVRGIIYQEWSTDDERFLFDRYAGTRGTIRCARDAT